MQPKHALRIVLSSPGDVDDECRALAGVIAELNRGVAHDRHVVFELAHWQTDAYPGFHPEGPESVPVPPFGVGRTINRLEAASSASNILPKHFVSGSN